MLECNDLPHTCSKSARSPHQFLVSCPFKFRSEISLDLSSDRPRPGSDDAVVPELRRESILVGNDRHTVRLGQERDPDRAPWLDCKVTIAKGDVETQLEGCVNRAYRILSPNGSSAKTSIWWFNTNPLPMPF